MKHIPGLLLVAATALLSATASADVALNSVRVLAKDAEALGRFYTAAFGLKETNRLKIATGVELFMNFGETVEAARSNGSPRIVVMQSPEGVGEDAVMHVIFTVSEAAATAAAVKAAGGTIEREPSEYGTTGIRIGFVVDPEGNHIELIQPARR